MVDPFFVWQTVITEDDYQALCREQNLLVDFSRFPYKLSELLDKCRVSAQEERPAFAAVLNILQDDATGRSATFGITETTTFRQITHLALRLSPVNEKTLRKHLLEVMQHYKVSLRIKFLCRRKLAG